MTRHIHEVEVLRADELDGRALEQTEVVLANVGSVLDGLASNLVDVGLGADDADCRSRRVSAEVRSSWTSAGAHHSPVKDQSVSKHIHYSKVLHAPREALAD